MPENGYEDLQVWQKAMDWVQEIYAASGSFPKEELYGLTSQLRRAAVSVPSNIAEGKGRYGNKEFRQFLFQARGSLLEAETQARLAARLGYMHALRETELRTRSNEIGKMLNGLINSLA